MRRFWWIVFLSFDGFILVAFLAGFLAQWIDPRTLWWPQLFAIALPHLSLIVLLGAIIFAFTRKWRFMALHACFVLLVASRFLSLPWSSSSKVDEATSLRIASYNLGHFEMFSQVEQAKKLGEVMQLLYPDLIGLQEFMVRYRGEQLRIRNLPYVANKIDSLGFQSVATDQHTVSTTFQPIFSRTEKLDQLEQARIPIQEPGYNEMGVIRMKFRWQGREAVYYNLHLRTFGEKKPWLDRSMSPLGIDFWTFYYKQYRDAFRYRAWQADQIHKLVEAERLPVIIGGDFNSTPHNWAFHRIGTGMKDAFAEAGNKRQASYHASFPLVRIDHLLVSPDWQVHRAEIPRLQYSDHRPLLVVLGFNNE